MSEKTSETADLGAVLEQVQSRRAFLRRSAVAAVAAGAASTLVGCKSEEQATRAAGTAAAVTSPGTTTGSGAPVQHGLSDSDASGGTNAPHPAAASAARAQADQMDAMHEKGVKAFPAKTEG